MVCNWEICWADHVICLGQHVASFEILAMELANQQLAQPFFVWKEFLEGIVWKT